MDGHTHVMRTSPSSSGHNLTGFFDLITGFIDFSLSWSEFSIIDYQKISTSYSYIPARVDFIISVSALIPIRPSSRMSLISAVDLKIRRSYINNSYSRDIFVQGLPKIIQCIILIKQDKDFANISY